MKKNAKDENDKTVKLFNKYGGYFNLLIKKQDKKLQKAREKIREEIVDALECIKKCVALVVAKTSQDFQ